MASRRHSLGGHIRSENGLSIAAILITVCGSYVDQNWSIEWRCVVEVEKRMPKNTRGASIINIDHRLTKIGHFWQC